MREPSQRSRAPLIATGLYIAIVLALFILAVAVSDEFGFSAIPLLYATFPLSLWLYHQEPQAFLFSVCVGGGANAALLYLLLKAIDYAKSLRRAK